MTAEQDRLFRQQAQEVYASNPELFEYLEGVEEQSLAAANDDAQFELIAQIHNAGNCYSSERFLELLKEVNGGSTEGFDGKIRFNQLEGEELCPGMLNKPVKKSDCGPLLLAIRANNSKAVKDLLAADKAVNLRESLRGPVDKY